MIEIEPYNEAVTGIKTATEYNNEAIMWVYSYKILDVMIDAGCANAAQEFRQFISDNPVNRLYISHSHEDHCGCMHVFGSHVEIFAGPMTRDVLINPPEYNEFFRWVWGQPQPMKNVRLIPQEFDVGDLHFRVIDLKGHSPEMVGFLETSNQWLFSADAVPLPSRKTIAMPEENVPQVIATMEKILDMDISILFDAHRGPIRNPKEHIQKRVDFLRNLQTTVKNLHEKGLAVEDIQKELKLEVPWYMDLTEGRFGIDLLIRSFLQDKSE